MISAVQFADGTGFSDPSGRYYTVDSKSMRKVKISEDIVVVAEN